MPGISDLDSPTSRQYEYYGTDIPPERVLIGRTFLAGAFYEDYRNEKDRLKFEYGQELFQEMSEQELPYNEIIVTWSTLSSVLAHLDNRSEDNAEDCLDQFRDSSSYSIHYPKNDVYQTAFEEFASLSGTGPNVFEFVDYLYMIEQGITRYIDWDSDFTYFTDITLLPHDYWRS